jgi:hypothetical protein
VKRSALLVVVLAMAGCGGSESGAISDQARCAASCEPTAIRSSLAMGGETGLTCFCCYPPAGSVGELCVGSPFP